MNYYQNEILANLKKQQIENSVKNAWVQKIPKQASLTQKVLSVFKNLFYKKTEASECLACPL